MFISFPRGLIELARQVRGALRRGSALDVFKRLSRIPMYAFSDPVRLPRSDKVKFIRRHKSVLQVPFKEHHSWFVNESNSLDSFDFSDSAITTIQIDPELRERVLREQRSFEARQAKLTQKNKKTFLRELTDINDYPPNSPIFKLATDRQLVSKIGRYLGADPVLWNISYMISPPGGSEKLRGSQLWHRDGEDVRNIKVWLLLDDISENDGPTHVIGPDESEHIAEEIRYVQGVKVSDAIINIFKPKVEILTGNLGDLKAFDSDRCFHMGSRMSSGSTRRVLMFHYVSRFCSYFWPNWISGSRQGSQRYPYPFPREEQEYLSQLLYLRGAD